MNRLADAKTLIPKQFEEIAYWPALLFGGWNIGEQEQIHVRIRKQLAPAVAANRDHGHIRVSLLKSRCHQRIDLTASGGSIHNGPLQCYVAAVVVTDPDRIGNVVYEYLAVADLTCSG
jgi:hypothetical protein